MSPLTNPGVTLGEWEAQRAGWTLRGDPPNYHWYCRRGRFALCAYQEGSWSVLDGSDDCVGVCATVTEAKATAERVAAALLGESPDSALLDTEVCSGCGVLKHRHEKGADGSPVMTVAVGFEAPTGREIEGAVPCVDDASHWITVREWLQTANAAPGNPLSDPALLEALTDVIGPHRPAFRGPLSEYATDEEVARRVLDVLRRFTARGTR